jgi:hypothetical protein
MFLLNGNTLPLDRPFSHNGVNYPANWLRLSSPAEKTALGITEQEDEVVSYDDRFYWGPNNPKLLNDREEEDEDGNPLYVKVLGTDEDGEPVMVDSEERLVTKGLKSQWVSQVKDTANKMLTPTDWYIVRKYEKSVAIPTEVKTFRTAVRAECERLETAITATTTVEELIEVVTNQNWPKGV